MDGEMANCVAAVKRKWPQTLTRQTQTQGTRGGWTWNPNTVQRPFCWSEKGKRPFPTAKAAAQLVYHFSRPNFGASNLSLRMTTTQIFHCSNQSFEPLIDNLHNFFRGTENRRNVRFAHTASLAPTHESAVSLRGESLLLSVVSLRWQAQTKDDHQSPR